MEKIVVGKCPVCDSINFNKVLTTSDYLVSGESFDIVECNECTLRFTSPIPAESEIGKYYKSEKYNKIRRSYKRICSRCYEV